ncbi:MAG: HAD family hydrolase [Endomicrobium sp.]|jgi:histidinol-phosphate phosphatase family protein|nr:HAD family hydrolase [Endomicrobium sp.]
MGSNNIKVPAVFLDRDGTIIFNKKYLNSPKKVKLFSFIAESIIKLKNAGFKIIVVTNQSGINRGILTKKQLNIINEKINNLLKKKGAKIDGFYYCPHIEADDCKCRKPKIGMVLEGSRFFNINLKESYVIGDCIKDYLLGFNMGGKGILVLTGHGKKQRKEISKEKIKPMAISKNLKEAVKVIVQNKKNRK